MRIELYPKFLSLAETRRYQPLYESIVAKAPARRLPGNVAMSLSEVVAPCDLSNSSRPPQLRVAKRAVAGPKRTGHELRPPPENTPGRVTSSFLAS